MGAFMNTCCTGEDASDGYVNRENRDTEKLLDKESDTKILNQMSITEIEFYQKCGNLTSKMSSLIIAPSPIQHDAEETNSWKYISQIADVCQDSVNEFLEKLINGIKSFKIKKEKNDYAPLEIIKAKVKNEQIAKKECKEKYDGNWLRVIDCCRAQIIYNNFKELYFILLILAKYNSNCAGFELVSIQTNDDDDDGDDDQKEKDKSKKQEIPDTIILIRPVPKNQDKEKIVTIDLEQECNKKQTKILNGLKMNLDEDDDEEFLNLPGHICTIILTHRAMIQ